MRFFPTLGSVSLAATAAGLIGVVLVPFLLMAYFAFTDISLLEGGRNVEIVGLRNFVDMLGDERLLESSIRTGIYTLLTIPAEVLAGLALALAVPVDRRWARWTIGLVAVPTIMSGISVGLMWRLLLNGDFGIAAYIIHSLSLYDGTILGDAQGAFMSLVLVDIWQWTPFCALIFLTGRIGIPEVELSAARLDGAGRLRVFWEITLPRLLPSLGLCVLFRAADCLRDFDKIVALTNGGPGASTELLTLYIWNVAFGHGELGYGSAITVVVYVISLFLAAGALWRLRERVGVL